MTVNVTVLTKAGLKKMFQAMVACQHNSFRPSLRKNTTSSPKFVKNQHFLGSKWFSPFGGIDSNPTHLFCTCSVSENTDGLLRQQRYQGCRLQRLLTRNWTEIAIFFGSKMGLFNFSGQ